MFQNSEIEEFHDDTGEILDQERAKCILLIGDINAKIGRKKNRESCILKFVVRKLCSKL